ncbi:DUF547 domain-containing protein [Desulfogranum mediterraneum]|uniref:DUF547 domain-containing protein n=1 Tax=Desulfogranum mediterraneum TaxID=160661 RepID=UPI00041AA03F|nr:DUF547 domain-containing protein [Desulfogranum mediterraneum]
MRTIFFTLVSLFTLFTLHSLVSQATAAVDHSPWDRLLNTHVRVLDQGRATQVDYSGFSRDRQQLTAYLHQLQGLSREAFEHLSAPEQLAFLINAYNAWTVELILSRYPDLRSIRELGSFFQSPWKKAFIPLLGKKRSLDEIEHELIRGNGRYREPRIHFAVNCASIGCPALQAAAYQGARLEEQLEESTRLFLQDRSRNRFRQGILELSAIFRWYRSDFEQGWRGADSLGQFLALYASELGLSPGEQSRLAAGELPLRFLDYDWHLNDTP